MSYSFKNNKQIEIIKEMQKAGERYEINGVDLSKAFFFYRKFQEAFQTIPPGSYEIVEEANNTYLRINDSVLLGEAVEFQVCYVFESKSSQYIDPFPDVAILQMKYNELQADHANLIKVLNSQNIFGDTLKMFYVLPELNENEVWVRTANGFRGFNIGDLEKNIREFWEQFYSETQRVITELKTELEQFTQEKIKQINDEGLKLEVIQSNHNFVFEAVQFDITTGKYIKASASLGADGIAVRIDDNKFYLVSNGITEIPVGALDSRGNAYQYDEYYFLDNDVAGGCTAIKPIEIFQPLFLVINKDNKKFAMVEIEAPVDLEPRILTDEINSLGLATTDQVVLSEPTIADLIASKKYKVGDVVHVLGYYTAGDGAGHPRQKKAAGYNGADAVIGADGSIWGIVHSGEVNVSWFGAKGDGITDDSRSIQKTIDTTTVTKVNVDMFCLLKSKILLRDNITFVSSYKCNGNFRNDENPPTDFVKKGFRCVGIKGWVFDTALLNKTTGIRELDKQQNAGTVWDTGTYIQCSNVNFENIWFETSDVLEEECFGAVNLNGSLGSSIKGCRFEKFIVGYSQSASWQCVDEENFSISKWIGRISYSNTQSSTRDVYCTLYKTPDKKTWDYINSNYANFLIDELKLPNGTDLSTNYLFSQSSVGFVNMLSGNVLDNNISEGFEYGYGVDNKTWSTTMTSGYCEKIGTALACISSVTCKFNFTMLAVVENLLDYIDIQTANSTEAPVCTVQLLADGRYHTLTNLVNRYKSTKKIDLIGFDSSKVLKSNEAIRNFVGEDISFLELSRINLKNSNKDKGIYNLNNSQTYNSITNNGISTVPFVSSNFIRGGAAHGIEFDAGELFSLSKRGAFKIFVERATNKPHLLYFDGTTWSEYNLCTTPVDISTGKDVVSILDLDTPYHATRMSSLGILDSYHNYLSELHEYEKSQNVQSDSEIMALNVLQPPVIPTEVEAYAKEYNLI